MTSVIERQCIACGTDMTIVLDDDNSIIEGGAYFGDLSVPVEGTGEYIEVEDEEHIDEEFPVYQWTGETEEMDWWECEDCYDELYETE